jgi:methyl-accepting chemotaxis protein
MQMNETVNQLSSLYTSTRSEASIGRSLLKELKEAMRSLDERANRIEGIVGFINDISKQVNLLALNASIEAARAGDAGRGFAVVADEVSRLADRISESVKNISSLVQGNREESKRSYENVTEAARLFNRVLVDMNMINDVIEEIGRLRSELSETNQYVAGQNQEINVIIKFIAQISKENKNSMYEIAVELESIMKLIQNHMNQEAELRDQAATLLNYGTEINEIMKFFKSSELDVESEERSKTETDAGFSAD